MPDWWRWPAVAAIAIATHATAFAAGFVWLDHAHLEQGLALAPPQKWPALFTVGFAGTGYYRPLMALSLSVDALATSPVVFHAVSVAWHAAASLLVVAAAQTLGLTGRTATLAGMLFAAHPLSALVAGAIAFRSEAMVAVALLGVVWAHRRERAALAAIALFAGALTKEVALVLGPVFVLALELSGERVRGRRALFAAEAAALAAALALRVAYAPPWRASHPTLATGEAIGTRLAAIAKGMAALVLPVDRSICDAFPVTGLLDATALAGLLGVCAVAWGAWRYRGPALLFGLALLPALQLVPVARWWSPHYFYLPLAFGAMLAARWAGDLGPRAQPVIVAALLLCGVVTLLEGRRYANDGTLWAPEVERQPACREGQFYLGEVARSERRFDVAAQHYERALAPWPGMLAFVDRLAALQNLGVVRAEQQRFAQARAAFRAALEGAHDPRTRRELTHDLAAATLSDGAPLEAAQLLEEEARRPDAFPQSLALRALALERLGRFEEANALRARLR